MKSQMKAADRSRARRVAVIVGADELAAGAVDACVPLRGDDGEQADGARARPASTTSRGELPS